MHARRPRRVARAQVQRRARGGIDEREPAVAQRGREPSVGELAQQEDGRRREPRRGERHAPDDARPGGVELLERAVVSAGPQPPLAVDECLVDVVAREPGRSLAEHARHPPAAHVEARDAARPGA